MEQNDDLQTALSSAKTLSEIGRKLNDKIEIRWLLGRDGEPEPERIWWGARVIELDEQEPRIVTVLYDSLHGFDESRSRVIFTSEYYIYDVEEKAELPYRQEGDSIDSTDCERHEQEIVTVGELIDANETSTDVVNEEMQKLPHTTQIRIMERLEDFKNGFIDFLKEKTNQRGANTLINTDDIAEFASKIKSKTP